MYSAKMTAALLVLPGLILTASTVAAAAVACILRKRHP